MRISIACVLVAALAGCADVNTFMKATGDVTSGRTDQQVAAAQLRQDNALAQNASLRSRLQGLQAQRATQRTQAANADARLRQLDARLRQSAAATAQDRATYDSLLAQQRALKQRLADGQNAPAPASVDEAAAQKQELDQLARQRQQLEKQIDVLQQAL